MQIIQPTLHPFINHPFNCISYIDFLVSVSLLQKGSGVIAGFTLIQVLWQHFPISNCTFCNYSIITMDQESWRMKQVRSGGAIALQQPLRLIANFMLIAPTVDLYSINYIITRKYPNKNRAPKRKKPSPLFGSP
ncbi:MAG: hypothetical protein KID09_01375 [Paenibacillus macerans]|nr:hypothetical protein [Paenibacillus macerans]